MPKTSYADLIHEWEAMLVALDANGNDLAASARERAELQAKLDELRDLISRKKAARALAQRCTQLINDVVADGKIKAICLRNSLKNELGPRSERLVQFGVMPMRKRSRRIDLPVERLPSEMPAAPAEPETDEPVS